MSDPKTSSFKGNLDGFEIVELIQAISLNNSTGALKLSEGNTRNAILYFKQGALIGAREYDEDALLLGEVLQQLGFVNSEQIDELSRQQRNEPLGEVLGQRLVTSGIITGKQLNEALHSHMMWTVREIALWKKGEYEFFENEDPPPHISIIPIDTSQVMIEAIRYQHEWSDLIHVLPNGMRTVLQVSHHPPIAHKLYFEVPIWRVIIRVNAFQTPRRIATASNRPELEVAKIAARLIMENLLITPTQYIGSSFFTLETASTGPRSIDFTLLLTRIEQLWLNSHSIAQKIASLATAINWTVEMVQAVQNTSPMPPNSLYQLLQRVDCVAIGAYELLISDNHVNIDQLTDFLKKVVWEYRHGRNELERHAAQKLLEEAFSTLITGMETLFVTINMRVDVGKGSSDNEQAWKTLLDDLRTIFFDTVLRSNSKE